MKLCYSVLGILLYIAGIRAEEEYYYCSDGQKILAKYECDGTPQCKDGTDEDPDVCISTPDLFKCDTPGETIPANKSCDGKPDCSDESDESSLNCRGHKCRAGQFRCSYGGCVNIEYLCDGKMDCNDGSDEHEIKCKNSHLKCKLPPQDKTVSYTVSDCRKCKPGDLVKARTIINLTCNRGYSFEKEMIHITAICEDAKWLPEVPLCRKNDELIARNFDTRPIGTCPPIISHGGNVVCQPKGNKNEGNCNKPVPPGTTASITCKQYYTLKGLNTATCLKDGIWSNELSCEPSCYQGNEVPLVVHGTVVKSGQKVFPWVAGLYGLQNNRWEYQCGSTLISDNVVITAAHCVWMKKPEDIKIVVGKIYSDYYKEEPNQQTFYVKDIQMLSVYQDRNGNYGSDVALLTLRTKVKLSERIHPACIQWNQNITDQITEPGSNGLVAGWGYTEDDKPSDELRFVKIPIVDSKKCIDEEPVEFRKYVTYTSFCAGYQNGTSVCNGDSGSGLMFQSNNTWYLEGIVSISPRRTNAFLCEPKLFSVFTKVGLYKPWIMKMLQRMRNNEYNLRNLDPYIF